MGLFSKFVTGPANAITGMNNAKDAAKKQGQYTAQALGEYDQFTNPEYKDIQRGITDRMGAGNAADIDESAYQENIVNPALQNYNQTTVPGVNQEFRSNPYSMSRQRAQQNKAGEMYSGIAQGRQQMQEDANTRQASALSTLQQAAQNRANIYQGAAANVQALPSGLDQLNDLAATVKNARGAYYASK